MDTQPTRLLIGLTGESGAELVEDSSIDLVHAGPLTGIALTLSSDESTARPSPELLLRIHETLTGLSTRVVLIPLRYGHFLRAPDELERQLDPDMPRWLELLERIGDAEEISLTVNVPRPARQVVTTSPGRAFLEARRRHHGAENSLPPDTIKDFRAQILTQCGTLIRDHRHIVHPDAAQPDSLNLEFVLLVARSDLATAFECCEPLRNTFEIAGPFLPFSFACI